MTNRFLGIGFDDDSFIHAFGNVFKNETLNFFCLLIVFLVEIRQQFCQYFFADGLGFVGSKPNGAVACFQLKYFMLFHYLYQFSGQCFPLFV